MIPRVFHRIWLGGPMPDRYVEWGEAWRRLHPGWEHRLWGETDLPELRNRALFDAAADYVRPERVGQFRSDLARYEILAEHGGIYVDCDFEPLRPLDDLLREVRQPRAFVAWEVPGRWVNNAIIGAVPGHSFVEALVRGIGPRLARARLPVVPGHVSGPQYVTRVYRQHSKTVEALPRDWFYPYGWDELQRAGEEFPDAYAVHHWANKRREAGVPVP